MYLGVTIVVLGMLLVGIGALLLQITVFSVYTKTLADFFKMCHNKKFLCGLVCFFLGVFILLGLMSTFTPW